MVIKHLLNN